MTKAKWNINYYCTVQLTEYGVEVFKKYEEQFNHIKGNSERTKSKLKYLAANDNKLRLQGWEMMHIFGNEMFLGNQSVFNLCEVEFENFEVMEEDNEQY